MASLWTIWCILVSFICSAKSICPDRCDCQHSQHLLCTNRGLRTMPKATIQNPEEILIYSLGGNFISNISAFDFTLFSQLIRLDLQYNQIQSIHPKTFEKLYRLEELYLGNNLIPNISSGTLISLKKLRILYVNSNEIKRLTEDSFANLDSLIKLRLDSNSIEFLQDALFNGLANLLYLQLESNKIRYIHKHAFANLGKLRFLNLSGNKQTTLRNVFTFSQLNSLTNLILSENEIYHVGNRVFQNLQKLSKLSLNNNKISHLGTEAFKGLSGLKELLIGGNLLTDIPLGLLDPLEKIEELDFSSNLISYVRPNAFKELKFLKVVKLSNNELTSLSGEMFAFNHVLYSLDLNKNNWTCDCRLRGFKQWINVAHAHGKLLTVFVQCHHPPVLKGKYLDYLNSSQLQSTGNDSEACLFSQSESIHRLTPRVKDRQKSAEQQNIQADQGGPGEADKGTAEKTKRKKEAVNHRARHPTTTGSAPVKDAAAAGIPERARSVGNSGGKNLTIKTTEGGPLVSFSKPTSHPVQAKAEKFHLLQRDHRRLPVVTDPCEFNRHFILNITAEKVESTAATIRWKVLDHQGPKHSQVHFRILFDRFGQPERFHRFIYIRDQSNSVTLQELKEDTTYMVCIESVIAEQVCQVASRDHCTGVVTVPVEKRAVDFQLLIVIMLGVNALLVFLVLSVWISRLLRKRLKRRKSAVHVRQMYSTRRPLRSLGTGVSSDFTGFQSNRPRNTMCAIDEADLIEFPCDRFLDSNIRREEAMQRFSN
ncbi:TLR4 interactor with leucine rich repeats [Polyodon spathula]|uniref:TLR4 interactor with leucine rich repeats n=1 Tax=Polyodon spathula TaxID=7913 RepID=UPI001B7D9903|nr:TLR4 interactor with leucine rich repeats [Polyodon spathula]